MPKSLFGQTLLVLLLGLVVSIAVGSWIYSTDREQAIREVGGFAAAQRIANLIRLVQESPDEWRERIATTLSDQTLSVSLSAQRPTFGDATDDLTIARLIKEFLAEKIPQSSARQLVVAVAPSTDSNFADWHFRGHARGMGPFQMMHDAHAVRSLRVAVPLADGKWLTFATSLPNTGPAFSSQFLISMLIMAIIIVAVAIWAARRVTAPLSTLAVAAERLGLDVSAPPIPETGTIETRQASRAFNNMQKRLRDLIDNRMKMLAAISHDLRTPLTLLKLRAENVEPAVERTKLLATIAEMNDMVEATLAFARDEIASEAKRPTDIAALLQSVVDDMNDAGLPVTMTPAQPTIYECAPAAIKRALTNLLDNAVKYGKRAAATLDSTDAGIVITIDDEGPGIPEPELKRAFEPFYRLEASRSRDTGGVGLGLAIAQSIIQLHGGQLTLANRPVGGIRAKIELPNRSAQRAR